MRRFAVLLVAVFALGLAARPALASEHAKSETKSGDKAAPGTSVDMPILVAPMTVDGKLIAYAYVSSTVVTTSSDAAIELRAKTPFIQDAFIRDVNGAPIVDPEHTDKVDRKALKARLLADVRKVVGEGKAVSVKFSALQVTRLRPAGI